MTRSMLAPASVASRHRARRAGVLQSRAAHSRTRRGERRLWRAQIARAIVQKRAMNENFSLIVMCLFLLGSLAFLAQQLTSYH